jgi:protoheme IX farnesyltransferase
MTESSPDILESGDAEMNTRAASAPRSRLVDFYELTKPRMNFLVVITTAVGYYMAVRHSFEWARLLHTIFGTALTAAGASVLNQYAERRYDALMPRTSDRPLPAGRISPGDALFFGVILGVTGVAYLTFAVNALTALLGAFTLLSYVFVYTPLKRYTPFNTVIGAVPGAVPPMMGVTAVQGAVSPEALALFGILFLWQMPHFLAIAILYRDDYARGGFQMLPVVDRDLSVTGRQIVLYSIALIPASIVPVTLGMAGITYFVMAMLLGLAFLSFGISCATTGTRSDARKLFFSSILYLPLLFAGLMIDKL